MASKSKITIKDVAKAANVSVATISYVINNIENMVSDETRKKVLRVIEELGYVPNITARSLVKNESRLIGVILPSKGDLRHMVLRENPFYLEFISGIEFNALEYGYNTLLVGVNDEKQCKDILNSRNFAGFITFDFVDKGIYRVLSQSDIPVVIIEDKADKESNISFLNSDNENGGFLAGDYLIKKGHRNIAFYTFLLLAQVAQDRLKGFRKAYAQHGLPFDEKNVIETMDLNEVVDMMIRRKYTAVFCGGDILAMNLMKAFYRKGIKIPDDISVVGYDDISSSQFLLPPLTTVSQHIFDKGAKAVDIILHNINHPNDLIKKFVMPVELVERETVKMLKA